MQKNQGGFTLVELLVTVAIIGILAAIALMNYRASLDSARQKRTMNDIRAIAATWESRAVESNPFAVAGLTFPTSTITYESLRAQLVPAYAPNLPKLDGWNRSLEFAVGPTPQEYSIRSAGRDGVFEASYAGGATSDVDCDIVFSSGSFAQYPSGPQQQE